MRTFQPLEKGIETKCIIVVNSSETTNHAQAKTLAVNILADMKSRKETNLMLTQVKKNISASKKVVQGQLGNLINLAVEGNRMLESVKPSPEVDTKSLKIKTKLEKMSDGKFLEECAIINSNLQKQKQQLQEYGYTDAQINLLSEALAKLNDYMDDLSTTNLSYSEIRAKRNSTDSIILERFDKLNQTIDLNKVLMPNLFRDYFAVKLVTTKKQQSGITGSVMFNGQSLANASIKLYANKVATPRKNATAKSIMTNTVPQEKLVYDKLSNSNGEINISDLKPDTYRLTISKNGYKSQEFTVYVNPKELTVVNIEMEKL